MATLNLLLLLLLISLKGCNQPHRRTTTQLTLVSLQAKGKKKKEEEAPKLPCPYLEENTMGMEEIFAQFLINAIFSLVCGDGSVGESWIFLLYAMQVCVYVCGLGGRGGKGKWITPWELQGEKGKRVFPSLLLSLAPGQTKLMGRGKKKTLSPHVRLLTNKV